MAIPSTIKASDPPINTNVFFEAFDASGIRFARRYKVIPDNPQKTTRAIRFELYTANIEKLTHQKIRP